VAVVPLESPHNSIHLAVGGFDVPSVGDISPISGANGDMGENDTAGLDPIFFFHHCFIDYTFWTWQKRQGATGALTIDPADPGASYQVAPGANNQPPAFADPNEKMSLATPLLPFMQADGTTPFTTADCINIETQLGYTYGPGSLDGFAQKAPAAALEAVSATQMKTVHVAGLDRSKISGSFLVAAYAEIDGKPELIGVDAVLSRWNVGGCSNCQTHLKTSADFRVEAVLAGSGTVKVLLHTHNGIVGKAPPALTSAGLVESLQRPVDVPFTVEII
jgi:tyrosinase